MKILDLFSGSHSIGNAFREAGHKVYSIDNFEMFSKDVPIDVLRYTDMSVDIMELTSETIVKAFGVPDVIWASPPCTKFSVASIGKNWIKGTNLPKTEGAAKAIELVKYTIQIIRKLNPRLYFIENPRGKLRKLDFIQHIPRYTVTYCQYGDTRMKPTDIWTNHMNPRFRPMCKNGDDYHVSAPRGSKTGTQGLKNNVHRSMIPLDLCDHIVSLCEE